MESALSFVEELPWEGRKIAVLGSMRELGDETVSAHAALGERLRGTGCDALFLFGEEMEHAWNALQAGAARGCPAGGSLIATRWAESCPRSCVRGTWCF